MPAARLAATSYQLPQAAAASAPRATPSLAALLTASAASAPAFATTAISTSAAVPASASVLDPLVQSYVLRASVDVERGSVAASETLTVRNRSRVAIGSLDLSVLSRALGAYRQDGPVLVAGRRASTRWTTGTNLRVAIAPSLPSGRSTTVSVAFHLDLPDGAAGLGGRLGWTAGILALGDWFPILSTAHDVYGIGDSQVTWTADRIRLELALPEGVGPDQVAASGMPISWDPARRILVTEIRHARNAAVAISPGYALTAGLVDGTRVRVLTLGADGDTILALASAALRQYVDWYGPYPYTTLDVAEAGAPEFGQEYPGLVFLGRNAAASAFAIWHEVAHEWWYALVGNDQIREPWIDEALATFSALWGLGIPVATCSTLPVDLPITAWPAEPTSGDWTGCDGYAETVYLRGAAFLDAVRVTLGTDRFFATLRAFVSSHRWRVVAGRELVDAFRAADIATDLVIQGFTSYR